MLRRTEMMPGGQNLTGVFAADLMFAEIGQLNAQQARSVPDLALQGCMQHDIILHRRSDKGNWGSQGSADS